MVGGNKLPPRPRPGASGRCDMSAALLVCSLTPFGGSPKWVKTTVMSAHRKAKSAEFDIPRHLTVVIDSRTRPLTLESPAAIKLVDELPDSSATWSRPPCKRPRRNPSAGSGSRGLRRGLRARAAVREGPRRRSTPMRADFRVAGPFAVRHRFPARPRPRPTAMRRPSSRQRRARTRFAPRPRASP